ncbi:MAG: hypothetical protein KJO08_03025, partial [Gammaproteobacteria bacterium]|nr:hypothetical protein [Gammaproteobacteria bacterium]
CLPAAKVVRCSGSVGNLSLQHLSIRRVGPHKRQPNRRLHFSTLCACTPIRQLLVFWEHFFPSLALDPGIHAGMTAAAKSKAAELNNAAFVIPPGIGGTQYQGRRQNLVAARLR